MILTAHVIELVHNIAAIIFFTVGDSRWKSYGTVSLVENHVIEMLAPSPPLLLLVDLLQVKKCVTSG